MFYEIPIPNPLLVRSAPDLDTAIHAFLTQNRGNYNAVKWGGNHVALDNSKEVVFLPPEFNNMLGNKEKSYVKENIVFSDYYSG